MKDLINGISELVKDIHIDQVVDVNVGEDRLSVFLYFNDGQEPLFLFKLNEPMLIDDFKEEVAFKVFDRIPGAAEAKMLHALRSRPFKGVR